MSAPPPSANPPAPPVRLPQSRGSTRRWRRLTDGVFFSVLLLVGGSYVALVAAMLAADVWFTSPHEFQAALARAELRDSIRLTLISCSITAIFAVWVATPLGYLLSRFRFPGRWLVEVLVDVPLVLPPLVVGLSLLILFHTRIGAWDLERWCRETLGMSVTYEVPAVILAQFAVATAFAVRTMRQAFDAIDPRAEAVARTLGCSRWQAFVRVTLPQAQSSLLVAGAVAWARALGEFGPILVFAGATRGRTEVLSTSVFLEVSVGHLEAAVAVALLMVVLAGMVLLVLRALTPETP